MESIELLRKLVSINSVFPNEMEIALFIEARLKEIGFSVKRDYVSVNRFNVLAERGNKGRPILFYGHIDTVPAFGEWESDPFILCEKGDALIGLGAWDMKAGVAAILMALEERSDQKVKIVFGVDEENISEGAHSIARSGFLDDVQGVVVTEAGGSDRLGPRAITLGRRGRAVYAIEVTGKTSHGAVKKGINAALVASQIVQFLEKQKMRGHKLLPPASQFVRMIHSEVEGLTIPDQAVIELDRHLVPPETFESVRSEIDRSLGRFRKSGARISVAVKDRKTPYLAPYVTDKRDPFVKEASSIVKSEFRKVSYKYGYSVADENVFAARGLPVVTIGPAGGGDHSANEWVSKKSYLELITVLKSIVTKIPKTKHLNTSIVE